MEVLVTKMENKARFFSDFGGLRIKESGLRLGDTILFRPFNGVKKEIVLSRLSYRLTKAPFFEYCGERSEIKMPFVSSLFTEYEMILCKEAPLSKLDESARYLLRASGANPFKLNGNYTFEAFLEYGDVVELEYTRLEILKSKKAKRKNVDIGLNEKIIQSKLSVLIEGETGTGKSRLAKAIHDRSLMNGHFVHINISSFSKGLIESELFGHVKGAFTGAVSSKQGAFAEANRGTLFIDEIDSLPLDIQTKLLLFLDNQKIRPVGGDRDLQLDVRLIFSSGKNLKELVKDGDMRKDFFYRLTTGGRVRLPSLRSNTKKIGELMTEFENDNGIFITHNLKKFYKAYSWPGNIRQLLGHLNQKLVLSGGSKIDLSEVDEELERSLLEEEALSCLDSVKSLEEVKAMYVKKIYERVGRNIKKTARVLKISPNTVRSFTRP